MINFKKKSKSLLRFGKNPEVDTLPVTVWDKTTTEILPTSNAITHVSSSNTNDDQTILIEGHTINDDELKFRVQQVVLDGTNKVALEIPLARATFATSLGPRGADLLGDVYIYQDQTLSNGVPTDLTKSHLKIIAGNYRSYKAATSISSSDYWIIMGLSGSITNRKDAVVDFNVQIGQLDKSISNAFSLSTSKNSGTTIWDGKPYFIVPKNSDITVQATSSLNNTAVEFCMWGVLAQVTN